MVSLDPFYLSRFYTSVNLGGEGVTVLVGDDGIIRARAPAGNETIGRPLADTPTMKLYAEKANGDSNTVSPIDGIKRIYSYRALEDYPLLVAVGMSERYALAGYDHDWRASLAVASVLSVLLFAIIARLAWHHTRLGCAREALLSSEACLADKSRLLEVTLENMSQGIMMVDAGSMLQISNRRTAELLNLPEEFLATRPSFANVMRVLWQRGDFGAATRTFEVWFDGFVSKHARPVWVAEHCPSNGMIIEIRGKRLSDGSVIRTLTDITERKQLDEALRQSRERLTLATEAARLGIWDWDVAANKLVWDDRMYELYGTCEQDFSGAYDAWQAGLHPDDLARGDAAIAAAIERVKDFDIEFRVLWPNGEVHDIEAHALVQGPANGRGTRMIGVNWDITERKRAMETIRLQADQYATMLATTSDGFWVIDRDGKFLSSNDAYCHMIGYSREELLKLTIKDIEAVESAEVTSRHMPTIVDTGFDRFESQHRRKDGVVIDVEGSVSFWRDTGQFLCFARDITERKRAREALQASEANYRDLFEATRDAIMVHEVHSGRCISANSSALKMFGAMDEQEFLSRMPSEYSPEWQPDGRRSAEKAHQMLETALRGGTHFFEWMHTRIDGTQFPADVLLTRVARGERVLMYGTIRDITERKQTDERIARMARYDNLTGLANRRVFVEALDQTIARAHRSGTSFAVLYLDLDHFKDVNDTLGHPVGDVLLETMAKRLRANVREIDTVARFGGDEFAVILSDISEPTDAAIVSERILGGIDEGVSLPADVAGVAAGVADMIVKAMTEPITIDANRIYSGATVGIAIYGPDSPDAETMLSHADVALYQAKAQQRGTYRFFTDTMDAEVRARVSMSTELRDAIEANQFFLVYQPQVDIVTGQIVGLEALARWCHPTLGTLGPGKFIPGAERNGLIVPLGRWVLGEACRQTKQWLDAGIAPSLVAVNLSGIQFKMPLQLEKDIAAALAESGLPPQFLELELTESVLMEASLAHNDVLLRLRKAGHRISIDDFGSGYSSLDYLRRYPVDRIKIAQTFISDIGLESGNDAIVRAALGLARELNTEVVVEGVETAAQLELLKSWGSRIVQGYYFAKPLPVHEVEVLLRSGNITPAHADPAETDTKYLASATPH
jgi:diguanylate cyclase (GGDEF)-like protein/PAS domain S-box-containing protein